MSNDQGPAGENGRLPPFRFLSMALAYAFGYAIGFCATSMAAGFIMQTVKPNSISAIMLFAIAPFSLIAGMIPWGLCAFNRRLMTSMEQIRVKVGLTAGYLACVGIVGGAVAGAGLTGLELVPTNSFGQVGVQLVMFGGPFLGIWWVRRMKPGVVNADYDDQMTAARKGSDGTNVIDFPNLAATEAFGRRLGELLFPNAVVALIGPLGAGKTHLVRAIAEGLGIANPAAVTSPTFTLIHEYSARLPIYHFDAYRLKGPNEFLDLGATEYFEAGGVCLIEWADKVESALPEERLTIRIVVVDENRRRVEISAAGERYESMVTALASGAA